MSLIGDLSQAIGDVNRSRCSVCIALATLPVNERQSLQEALNSPLGAVKLSRILQKNGIAVGVPSIHRHRSEGHS